MNRVVTITSAAALALLLVAGGVIVYLLPLAGRPAPALVSAQGASITNQPNIVVTSEGTVSAAPDQASISVGVQVMKPTAAEALAGANAATEAVLAKLDSLGIARANIQTSGVGLYPVQQAPAQPGGEGVITGYRATNQLTVLITDLGKVGQVLDAVVSAGANQVGGVRFGLKDDTAVQRQAMQEAIQRARPQADATAAGLGLKTGQVLAIREDSSASPAMPAAQAAIGKGGVPIEPGQLTARARVQVTFALVPIS